MKEPSDQAIHLVAQEIEKNRKDILQLFEKKLKEYIEIPPDMSGEEIISMIPHHIDCLIQTLIKFATSKDSIDMMAQEQAKLRPTHHVMTLEILISEYIILKDVIFEILSKSGPVNLKASNIIWQFIIHSIKTTVREFEIKRMDESEGVLQELDDSEVLNNKIKEQVQISRENEERYRTMIEGVEDYAIFTLDPNGVITSWNPGAEKMKGYTYSEAIGSHFSMLYPEEGRLRDEPMDHLHVALIEGRYRGEGLRQRKNREIFLADVYIRPVFKNGKHLGFAKVVEDVTERNKILHAADKSKTEIVELKSEKDQREKFVLTLSHDLRGPLSVARASVELLGRGIDPSDKHSRYVDKAIVSIDRVNKMISNLLDANRIARGELPQLNLQSWDLVRLVRNVCDDFMVLGPEITVHCECQSIIGKWDGEGLRRVMENLISNAVKYGDRAHPIIVSIVDLGNEARILVNNKGDIIKEDDLKTLFDQFKRTDASKSKTQGWGIGLSLVRGIVEAHRGTVAVESYPVKGTTFTVSLPK